ncbi:MAG: division/cell wall cluster transcriptional repressor MraZ [Deltaproteobacteria bacterium]|nr:division/cell wall cluster transcriptional repressor MraZ [Deltaproteobacteria bacterium]
MFRGRFEHTIDPKGRLSIPSRFRETLVTHYEEERLILTNFDASLWAYPLKEWKLVEEKVAALPQFKSEVKTLQRFFISAACECPLDKQGRILIPPTLRDYSGLSKDVVIVGMTRRIEIWSRERWQKIFSDAERDIEKMGDNLANLGL